jgi:hypothetical protein
MFTPAIVKVVLQSGTVCYYSGKSGTDWLCEKESEAFQYGFEGAQRMAETLQKAHSYASIRFHAMHLPHEYLERTCILRNMNKWDLYLMPNNPSKLMALPTEKGRLGGCRESFFGDREHLRTLMNEGYWKHWETFTERGLEFMEGLACGLRAGRLRFDLGERSPIVKPTFA